MAFCDSTMIDGINYHNLHISEADMPIDFHNAPIAYMREDNGRIFMKSNLPDFGNADEIKIYDFTLSQGDAIEIGIEGAEIWKYYNMKWEIADISDMVTGNSQAQVQHLIQSTRTSPDDDYGLPESGYVFEAVEGIGATNAGILCFPFIMNRTSGIFPWHFFLNEVISDGQIIYQSKNALLNESMSDSDNIRFECGQIIVDAVSSWSLKLFTVDGATVFETNGTGDAYLSTDILHPGMYIARLTTPTTSHSVKFTK